MAETIECGAEQLGADYAKFGSADSKGFFFRITKWILQIPATKRRPESESFRCFYTEMVAASPECAE